MSEDTKRDIDLEAAPGFIEEGTSGLKRYSGFVREEWHKDLKGSKAAKIYREMQDNEPIIGVALLVIELLLRNTPLQINRSKDESVPEDVREDAREFCESAVYDMQDGFSSFMGEMLSVLPYGWAWMEKVFKIRRGPNDTKILRSKHNDGRIGWRKIALRAQDTLFDWRFDASGDVLGMRQMALPDFRMRTIPRNKALHVRLRQTKNNPEGYSILRPIYTPYFFKKNMQFVEAVGVERDLAGYPVMEVPPQITAPDARTEHRNAFNDWKDFIRKLRRDQLEGAVIPSEQTPDGKMTGFRLRLLNAGGRRPADADAVIKRYRAEIAIGLLVQFLLLGTEKTGSFALSSDQTDLLAVALGAVLDTRDELFNDDAFPELMELNGFPAGSCPEMRHGDIETPNLADLAAYLTATTQSGSIVTDDKLEDYLREVAGLPPADRQSAREAPQQQSSPNPLDGLLP